MTDRKNRGSVPEGVTRTQFAARNSAFGLVGKAVSLIANFVSRTVFIYILGKYYLGVNGLYTEILSFLSFAELGFFVFVRAETLFFDLLSEYSYNVLCNL